MGATHVEKSTMTDTGRASRPSAVGGNYLATKTPGKVEPPKACSILDPECEACQ